MPIISIEIIRGVLVTKEKNNKLIAFITLLFILLEMNFNELLEIFPNKQEIFKYTCSTIIPLIASSMLYTYLTLKGSPILSLTYRLFKELPIILLPVLPNENWFAMGSFSLMFLVITYLFFKRKFENEARKKGILVKELTFLLSIILVLFMLGAFKYEPMAILSNSMAPTFSKGDLIIYRKIDENEKIPINSIIVYNIENKNIVHRVIEIVEENGDIFYKTKGDRNNVPDMNLVSEKQVKGIYKFSIKYIGFPSVLLYDYFNDKIG